MTPSDAPDAPRDLLDEVERALQQATPGPWVTAHRTAVFGRANDDTPTLVADCEPFKPHSSENSANADLIAHTPEWLALLVQRARDAEAETARLREALEHIVANEQCEVAKTGVSPIKTCLDHQIVVPCPYCIAKQALGASRPGEPQP